LLVEALADAGKFKRAVRHRGKRWSFAKTLFSTDQGARADGQRLFDPFEKICSAPYPVERCDCERGKIEIIGEENQPLTGFTIN